MVIKSIEKKNYEHNNESKWDLGGLDWCVVRIVIKPIETKTMNATTMNNSKSWEDWIDVWSGFWLEGVALPIVAAFGIIGEKFYWHKIFMDISYNSNKKIFVVNINFVIKILLKYDFRNFLLRYNSMNFQLRYNFRKFLFFFCVYWKIPSKLWILYRILYRDCSWLLYLKTFT